MSVQAARVGVVLLTVLVLTAGACAQDLTPESQPVASSPPADVIGQRRTVGAGEVVGPLRVGNGHLEVLGRVRGDVTATRSPVVVRDGGVVEGDIRSFAGPVTVAGGGSVEGSVTANAAEGRVKSGGWVRGDLSVFGSDASVEAGGEVGGKVVALGGQRRLDEGAVVGGAIAGGQEEPPGEGLVAIGVLALLAWLIGTIFGAALSYGISQSAPTRLEVVADVWRRHAGRTANWTLSLVGLTVLLALVPCIGWLAAVPLTGAVIGATALAWPVTLRLIGERFSRGGSASPRAATLIGFAVWSAVGLIGAFPCLLPFVLLAKWFVLLMGAAAALLTDWVRDPLAEGCWPMRRRRPSTIA